MFPKHIFKTLFYKCALPLLIGAAIYLFFHKPNLLLHIWVYKYFQLPNYYAYLQKSALAIFLLNHLPDCLWALSLSWFLVLFIANSIGFKTKAALIVFLVSFTEIVQVFFPKQFTFDWVDLFLSFAISFVTLKYWPYEKENSV